jgi:glycerol uptake facilitator-like aquaporin
LATRYLLDRRRAGAILLACVPLVDLVLLAATVADLGRGATAEFAHGLAAAYLGFSVAFGHSMIRWADQRFAHRFAGGPAPQRPARAGRARTRYEWREFGKALIACGLLVVAIVIVGDADRTAALEGWIVRLTIVVTVWSLWPITSTVWPARPGPPGAARSAG